MSHEPPWPVPKIFRLTDNGKLIEGIFNGETINTPSMVAVEDYLDALKWVQSIGGLDAMHARADANAKIIDDWVKRTPWVDFLAVDPETRSNTSICLSIVDPDIAAAGAVAEVAKGIVKLLEVEGVGFDLGSYRDAPARNSDLGRRYGRSVRSGHPERMARLGVCCPERGDQFGRLNAILVSRPLFRVPCFASARECGPGV